MSEEKVTVDNMSWDEHLRAGVKGFKAEVREEIDSHDALREVRKHGRAAMKETLLAWRSLLDGAINRIEDMDKQGGAQRVTKIKIE